MRGEGLVSFPVCVKETDLCISVAEAGYTRSLPEMALDLVHCCRGELERYIDRNPAFLHALQPTPVLPHAPGIVRMMAGAAARAGVGPMAAVAGAIAEVVGRGLLHTVREVIVENGGDIFMKTIQPRRVGIFAGQSPLSDRVGLLMRPDGRCCSICTSSGTVGPSLSFGQADAAVVISRYAALADAVATAMGNRVKDESGLALALQFACGIRGVQGAVVILGDKLGAIGEIELI
jgi:hypothetical protein